MLPAHVLTTLEDWRSEFESDSIIWRRDRSSDRLNKRYVRKTFHEIADQIGLEAVSFGSCRMVFAPDRQSDVGSLKRALRTGCGSGTERQCQRKWNSVVDRGP